MKEILPTDRKVTIRVLAHDHGTPTADYEKSVSFTLPTDLGRDSQTMFRVFLETSLRHLRQEMIADQLEILGADPS